MPIKTSWHYSHFPIQISWQVISPFRYHDISVTSPFRYPDITVTSPFRYPDITVTSPFRYPDITQWLSYLQISWHYRTSLTMYWHYSGFPVFKYHDITCISIYPYITQWLFHLLVSWHNIGSPIFRYPDITQWFSRCYRVTAFSPNIQILHYGCHICRYPDITQSPDITQCMSHLQMSWHHTAADPHPDILTLNSDNLQTSWHHTVDLLSPDSRTSTYLDTTLAFPAPDILKLHSDWPISRCPDITQSLSHAWAGGY